jgi:hypothetical protein
MQAMVEAVPITPQLPTLATSRSFTASMPAASISPARWRPQ